MSSEISPTTAKAYGLQRVCRVFGQARSGMYSKLNADIKAQPGPRPVISDEELDSRIKKDISESPFSGEGHRKVHARIRRQGHPIGKNRVWKRMQQLQLLSPYRHFTRGPNPHTGKIITEKPNEMWCSDGTKVQTVKDGWVWVFSVEEHWNAECLGWHVCKHGDRFAAFEPVSQAIRYVYGKNEKGTAQGLKLRIDNGSQYTSDYFLQQLQYLGVEHSFGLVRQPETNGVAERFNRTMKEQVVHGRVYQNVGEVREAVQQFAKIYNEKWLLAKLGYKSPLEIRRARLRATAA